MATPEPDRFVEQYHQALDAFFRGDPGPAQALYSHEDDASLANPFGPVAVGWAEVSETMERAAANYRDIALALAPGTSELQRGTAKAGASSCPSATTR